MKILVGKDVGSYNFAPGAAGVGTITFSGLGTVNTADLGIITETASNTIIYQFNKALKGGDIVNNVLTLDFNTAGMVAGSEGLRINLQIGDPTIDHNLALVKTQEQSPAWAHFTDPATLVTDSDIGAVDSVFLSQGSAISTRGYKTLKVLIDYTANDSLSASIQFVVKDEAGSISEFLPLLEENRIADIGSANVQYSIDFDLANCTAFVQIQTRAGEVIKSGGSVEGTVTIKIIKGY